MSRVPRTLVVLALLALPALVWLLVSRTSERAASRGLVVPEPGFPMLVRSPDHVEHTLSERPERILPGNAAVLDLLTELVEPERVAAVPKQAADYSCLPELGPAWQGLPVLETFTAEPILGARPDLVVTHSWHDPNTVATVRANGVPVIVFPVAGTYDELRESIRLLGRLVGADERAELLIAQCDARRDALLASADERRGVRALSYTNFSSGGWTAGARTTADIVFRLAGIVNAAAEAGMVDHVQVTFEQLYAIDPDVIVVGADDHETATSATGAFLRRERALAELSAVRAGRIVVLPDKLHSTTSHYMLDAAEELAAKLDALDE